MNQQEKQSKICRIKISSYWAYFSVEMAGIEPASERLDHQISTSVVKLFCLAVSTLIYVAWSQPAAWTLEPSFLKSATSVRAHQLCDAWSHHRLVDGVGRRDLSRRSAELQSLLGSERKCSVGSAIGTWFFVLIFRVRYLSARNPGPASSVEACHPR